jgi:hypothetical protein
MKLLIINTLVLLLLIGCTTTKCPPDYKIPEFTHPDFPRPAHMEAPYFYVVNKANLFDITAKFNKESEGVFIAMAPNTFETIILNYAELLRYIQQSNAIIFYYRNLLSADSAKPEK